jgi:Amt family ammonium transporter
LKKLLKVDDSLDVFGVHAVGGITGALLTGIFNSPDLGGPGITDYVTGKIGYPGMGEQLLIQAKAVGVTFIWTAVVAFISFKIADLLVGMRVSEGQEREGLDTSAHGDTDYN